jgi:hypothetical protein
MDLTAVKRVDFRIRWRRSGYERSDCRRSIFEKGGFSAALVGMAGGTVDLEDPEGNAFNHIISNMTV